MKVGIHPVSLKWSGGDPAIAGTLAAMAETADMGGVDYFAMMDHYFMLEGMGGDARDPMLEGYTTSAYLAALTKRMRIGLLVTGVTYRHPGLLAKIVTTLDVLSGGRGCLGIGAAWYEREHLALGVPFPPLGDLRESLRVLERYAAMGIDLAVFVPRGDDTVRFVERTVGDLVPALAQLGAAKA